jgi:hypothetical protein
MHVTGRASGALHRLEPQEAMVKHEQDRDANAPKDTRGKFEEFTAGPAWRQLPLKIKLMLLHLWRAERDVPPKSQPD